MTDRSDNQSVLWPGDAATSSFERFVLVAVQLLLMGLILVAVADLIWLMWHGLLNQLVAITDVEHLQRALQRGFAGILLVLIGLELLETLRAYLHDRHVRLEVVLIVAVIAMGRHIIMLDFERMHGLSLLGVAALMLALTGGYFLIRRIASDRRRESAASISSSNPESSPEETKR